MKRFLAILAIVLAVNPTVSEARRSKAFRANRGPGFYISSFGDPFPSLLGINFGYFFTSWLQIHAGYGNIRFSDPFNAIIGLGTKLYVPGWNFSPFVGYALAQGLAANDGTVTIGKPAFGLFGEDFSFGSKDFHFYTNMGFSLITKSGFQVSIGYNLSLRPGVGGLPYLSMGFYF